MAGSILHKIDPEEKKSAVVAFVVASIILHVIVLVIVPLVLFSRYKPKKFTRPATMTLVKQPIKKSTEKPVKKPTKKPVKKPVKKPTKKPVVTQKAPVEDTSFAASLIKKANAKKVAPKSNKAVFANFKDNSYNKRVVSKVLKYWKPSMRDGSKSVVLYFEIRKNGSISAPVFRKRSGIDLLDRQAKRAIENAKPFPKLPKNYNESVLRVTFTLVPDV